MDTTGPRKRDARFMGIYNMLLDRSNRSTLGNEINNTTLKNIRDIGFNSLKPNDIYIYVSDTYTCKLTTIGSDNGLSPGRRQDIIWMNAGILLIPTLRTNFSEILIEIHTFSFKRMHLKPSSAKWRLFSLGSNEF